MNDIDRARKALEEYTDLHHDCGGDCTEVFGAPAARLALMFVSHVEEEWIVPPPYIRDAIAEFLKEIA